MSPEHERSARRALTWVEVDTAALDHNLRAFRRRLGPEVELAQVVKSNAYGHGLELVAAEAEASGMVQRLAVVSVEELAALRRAGVRLPVLILGYVSRAALEDVVRLEGTPVVTNRDALEALSRAAAAHGREVPVHLKVETGTHRYGIAREEILEVARRVLALPGLTLEGIATHFANIEDTTDHDFARSQIEAFGSVLAALHRAGIEVPLPHAACSAAAVLFPESYFRLARVGISSYGIWPSKQTRVSSRHHSGADLELRPVLAWKTRVAQVKTVPAGGYVGYGCTWRAPVETRLAVLPVGYADGYDRGLGNTGHVLIGGGRAPVRGRVCMNVTLVDVTHCPGTAVEDEVVLIGSQGEERVTADQVAEWLGTIPYEVVARIAEHLPRVRV